MASILDRLRIQRQWLAPVALLGLGLIACSGEPGPIRGTEAPAQLEVTRDVPTLTARPTRTIPPDVPHDVYDPSDGRPHPPMDLVTGERIRRELLQRGR